MVRGAERVAGQHLLGEVDAERALEVDQEARQGERAQAEVGEGGVGFEHRCRGAGRQVAGHDLGHRLDQVNGVGGAVPRQVHVRASSRAGEIPRASSVVGKSGGWSA
jgi:hypothetical protein